MNLFELFVTLNLDAKNLMRGIGQQRQKISDFAVTIQKKTSAAAVAVGHLAAQTVTKTVSTAVSVTKQALNVVKEYEQNLGGSEAVWGEWADSIQAKSTKAFKTMGLSASDYLATANQMGSLFKGAGFTTGEAMEKTTQAMQRAADVASIMGIDADWAMESIAGLAKGNFTMMDNLGVAINDTTLANYALEKGIKKSTSAMTTQEKIGLALELFMERTADYAGNYAKENDTLAGSYEVLSAAYENMLIGQEGATDDFVDALEMAAKATLKNLGQIIPRLGSSMWQAIQKAAPKVKAAFVDLWDNKLPEIVTNGANAIINGINDIFGTEIPTISQIKFPTWAEIEGTVTTWWNDIKKSFSNVISFDGIVAALPEVFDNFKSFAVDVGIAFNAIGQWVVENQDVVLGFIKAIGYVWVATNPAALIVAGLALIITNWDSIKTAISNAWSVCRKFYEQVVPQALKDALSGIAGLWDTIVAATQKAIDKSKEYTNLKSKKVNGKPVNPLLPALPEVVGSDFSWAVGEYATGLPTVPYDNFPAYLHAGEAVLTRTEAERWRRGEGNGGGVEIDYSRLASAVALAVSGISVNMDGQAVGRLVSPTVSREIAHEAKARRFSR